MNYVTRIFLHGATGMKNDNLNSLSRLILYIGTTIQVTYILITPIAELSIFIMMSSALIIAATYIDLVLAKKELAPAETKQDSTWEAKRKKLQDFYNNDENLNKSFSKSLEKVQQEDSHNQRIAKILESYESSKQNFKIKLNRKPENRLDQYIQE